MKRALFKALMLTQKYDCRCFYRNSKANKKAKRTSNKRVRRFKYEEE